MDLRDVLIVVGAAGGGGLVAWAVVGIISRIAHRRYPDGGAVAVRLCRRPFVFTAMAVAVLVAAQSVDADAGWRRVATIAVIGSSCWLIVQLLRVGERVLFRRLDVDVEDNRRVRRARTQVALLRRVIAAVVILLGIAASLMSFPGLRTFGASLLASAGLAGIVAGLAAQTTLANVFAGLQLAFTDAVRIDDVVVVEEEWGWIEEITLTYVVVHIWDERRLVLPTSYFTTTPFQNWTRTQARLLGSVMLYLDYATPLGPLRDKAREVIEASPLWDGQDWVLQVVDTTETTMVVRVLASAHDGPTAWDLRCDVREALLVYLQAEHPQALPVRRLLTGPTAGGPAPRTTPGVDDATRVGREGAHLDAQQKYENQHPDSGGQKAAEKAPEKSAAVPPARRVGGDDRGVEPDVEPGPQPDVRSDVRPDVPGRAGGPAQGP